MPEARPTASSSGRHETRPARGAHERVPAAPRHAATGRRYSASVPVAASIAVLAVAVMALPALRPSAADTVRAVGAGSSTSTANGQPETIRAEVTIPSGGDATPATSPRTGAPASTGDPVLLSSPNTREAVVGLDRAADPDVTSAFLPWFPRVDDTGAPVPTRSGSPDDGQTAEVPPVPVEFTPDPTPFPTQAPTPPAPVEPTPTSTPSYDPTTPAPTPSPSSWVTSPTPWTPTPDPTPSPTAPSTSALRYSPPALVGPTVLALPEGSTSIRLDVGRDYILTLPRDRPLVNTLGLTIVGGRNVVIIGGTVDVRDGEGGVRRGMYLKDATPNGTTYVEGVRFISSTTGALTEGIDIASPGARVVLQNIAITGALTGSYATNHADIVQAWAGPRVLQIDGLSASTRYQGFFLLPNQHDSAPVSDWSFHRMALSGVDSAYLLWRDGGSYAIRTSDVYVSGSRYSGGGLWPAASSWPGVVVGPPPVAYAATAGFGYMSPGYL